MSLPSDQADLLKDLDEALGEEVPEDLRSEENDDDQKGKAKEAFARQRVLLKQSKDEIAARDARIAELEQKVQSGPQASPTSSGVTTPQDKAAQAMLFEQMLVNQAMRNLDIADPANPLVQREAQRLYSNQMAALQRQDEAASSAPTVVESTIAEFEQLDDDDRAVLKERIASLPVTDQADPASVKREVHLYMGENLTKFAKGAPSGNGQGDKGGQDGQAPSQGVPSSGAAVSRIKAQGSGVRPPETPQGGEPPKPLKPEERDSAIKLGLDPNNPEDVATFRKAQRKKGKYAGRTY